MPNLAPQRTRSRADRAASSRRLDASRVVMLRVVHPPAHRSKGPPRPGGDYGPRREPVRFPDSHRSRTGRWGRELEYGHDLTLRTGPRLDDEPLDRPEREPGRQHVLQGDEGRVDQGKFLIDREPERMVDRDGTEARPSRGDTRPADLPV